MTVAEAIKKLGLEFPYKEPLEEDEYYSNVVGLSIAQLTRLLNKQLGQADPFEEDEVYKYLKDSKIETNLNHSRFGLYIEVNMLIDTPSQARIVSDVIEEDIVLIQDKEKNQNYKKLADVLGYLSTYFKSVAG